MREAWAWILDNALGDPRPQPTWAERYALTRFTVSSPTLQAWFKGYDHSRPREQHIRPGSFGLIAHPDSAFYSDGAPAALPAGPYESKPERWTEVAWYDRATGKPLHVLTGKDRDEPERFSNAVAKGAVIIDTLANVLGRYTRRPEHKSRAPGGQAAGPDTKGLLQRRPITSHPASTLLTGKEGNKIIERLTGEVSDVGDYRNDFGIRTDPWDLILPVLQNAGASALIDRGIPRSTAHNSLHGAKPRDHNEIYLAVASDHATTSLERWGLSVPADPLGRLTAYLREHDKRGGDLRRCAWCGEPLRPDLRSDARYDSAACRKAASRRPPFALTDDGA